MEDKIYKIVVPSENVKGLPYPNVELVKFDTKGKALIGNVVEKNEDGDWAVVASGIYWSSSKLPKFTPELTDEEKEQLGFPIGV